MKRSLLIGAMVAGISLSAFTAIKVLPVWAVDAATSGTYIDKEFEVALRKHFEKRFFNFIDASEKQQQQITELIDRRMDETRPQREKIRHEIVELSEMCASDASDEQVTEKAHQIRSLHEKLMDERLATALKVRALLTPDQRKAVSDKIVGVVTGQGRARFLRGS